MAIAIQLDPDRLSGFEPKQPRKSESIIVFVPLPPTSLDYFVQCIVIIVIIVIRGILNVWHSRVLEFRACKFLLERSFIFHSW
jgi:hypothetical protein